MTTSGLRCQSRVPQPRVQETSDSAEDLAPGTLHIPLDYGEPCAKTADVSTWLVATSTAVLISTMQVRQAAEVLAHRPP